MWPRRLRAAGRLLALLLLLLLLLPAVHVQPELTVYGKLGGNVSLTPGNVNAPIASIIWKEGMDIAMEWDGESLESYRHYRERAKLDTTTGVMTITGLVKDDSKIYQPEVNDKSGEKIRLSVISAVPVPTVFSNCNEAATQCELTCSANTTGAEPVGYAWKSDGSEEPDRSKTIVLEKEGRANVKDFSCELHNGVSRESSQRIANPFTPRNGLNIPKGLVVFISLLVATLLLVGVHRLKAGVWFYKKGSMPWEADFWRKQETAPTDAARTNGTSAAPQHGPSDEETALT